MPPFAFAAGVVAAAEGALLGVEAAMPATGEGPMPTAVLLSVAAAAGRVLAGGGGTWLGTRCVALGCEAGPDDEPAATWLDDEGPWRFGSDARPGGGGGFEGDDDVGAARTAPEVGAVDGSGGGTETRPPDAGGDDGIADADVGLGGIEGVLLAFGGGGGIGSPVNVFFVSKGAGTGAVATPDAVEGVAVDPGGGGGAADVRPELFFPRPSKMSRSEPLLLSSDIRVS